MTIKLIDETLTSATTSSVGEPKSNSTPFKQRFLNFEIRDIGTSTVEIQASVDGGANFVVSESFVGTGIDASKSIFHASPGVQYRFEVTSHTGGDEIKVTLLD